MERDKTESKPSSWTAGLLVRITVYHSSSGIVLLLPSVSGQCHCALISIHKGEVVRTVRNLYVPNNCAFVSICISNYTSTMYRHKHYIYILSCSVYLQHPTLSTAASYSYYCRRLSVHTYTFAIVLPHLMSAIFLAFLFTFKNPVLNNISFCFNSLFFIVPALKFHISRGEFPKRYF